MNLIVPGLNKINRELMAPLCQSLVLSWELLEYPWWHNQDSNFEVDIVIHAIKSKCPELIIAKSIGTLLTSLTLRRGCPLPKAMVFIGIPKKAIDESEYQLIQKTVKESGIPILVIQQRDDHLGAFLEIREDFLAPNMTFEKIEGYDHLYDNHDRMVQIIDGWLCSLRL